jgi:membrane protease YdiL (CAAX protease family)
VLVSAVMFGALHFSYNSTYGIEVIAALLFGLITGYAYKKTNSLYPALIAHIMVNTLTILSTALPMLAWVH